MIKNFLSKTDFLFDTVLFILTVTVPHDPLNAIQSYSVAIQTRSIIIRTIQYFIQNNAKILQILDQKSKIGNYFHEFHYFRK